MVGPYLGRDQEVSEVRETSHMPGWTGHIDPLGPSRARGVVGPYFGGTRDQGGREMDRTWARDQGWEYFSMSISSVYME